MALSIINFNGNYPIRWQWPLKVGLPDKLKAFQKQLLANKWPMMYAPITGINKKVHGHFNIIFLVSGVKPEEVSTPGNITADIVIVFQKKYDAKNRTSDNPEMLAEFYKASGVFIIQPENVSSWFSFMIVELSHNHDIFTAIQLTGVNGKVLYDTRIQNETKISSVVEKIINRLRAPEFAGKTFAIETRYTPQKSFTGNQVADLLQAHVNEFVYVSEEGDAKDIKQIAEPVFNQIGERFFEEKHTARAKPPDRSRPAEAFPEMAEPDDDLLGAPPKAARPSPPIKIGVKKSRVIAAPKKAAPRKAIKKGIPKAKARSVKKPSRPIKPSRPTPGIKKSTRKSKASKPKKAVAPTVKTEPVDNSRFLQAKFKSKNEKDYQQLLQPGTEYKIEVFIGLRNVSFSDAGVEFDTATVFKESKQKKETINLEFKSNFNEKSQFKEIKLPREGDSNPALFDFKTNASSKIFTGDIYAFHRNRMIQHVEVTAPIKKGSSPAKAKNMKMKNVALIRSNLDDLSTRTEFNAGIEVELGKNKSARVHGVSKNKPVDLFFADGLKVNLMDMKDAIEGALIDIEKHPANLTAAGNQELLLLLALKGNLIYTNHLRDSVAPDGPLQIVTNQQNYVPIDFVYSKNAPDLNATLCKNAASALNDGKCKNCFDQTLDPAPHICPFGFWSFSRVIERHSFLKRKNVNASDYSIVSEPQSKRSTLQLLQKAIFAASKRVETTQTRGILKEIANSIHKNINQSDEAIDWDNWSKLVTNEKPDSLILIVHIEKDKKVKIDKIEIGVNKFVLQNYIGSKVILKNYLKPPPFVIIMGCESSNLKESGFDVSAQLINEGAAIVLSNFTKIRGRQAKDIVIRLLELLKQNGKKDVSFGEVMLKLRQKLMSEGLMASLSLVAQGDADWKIKT